jgi:hypothetical protein
MPLARVESGAAAVVVELPMLQEFVTIGGGATIGLSPPLSSSVAPRGIALPGRPPALIPPASDVDVVPDAVPADVAVLQEPAVPALMPPPSNVELELVVPAFEQGRVVTVGSSAAGLSPPGESSVEPSGIPTGPTEDVAPGISRGDVTPMAGGVAPSDVI